MSSLPDLAIEVCGQIPFGEETEEHGLLIEPAVSLRLKTNIEATRLEAGKDKEFSLVASQHARVDQCGFASRV